MSTTLTTKIRLRKDTLTNYEAIEETFIPLDGEVCIVDAKKYGLRIKIGDGISNFKTLNYIDNSGESPVIIGVYWNGKFYTDSAHGQEIGSYNNRLYVDWATKNNYYYNDATSSYVKIDLPKASSSDYGVVKLYSYQGSNTDGTITQKFFTESIDGIKFKVGQDSGDNYLDLEKPW